MKANHIGVDIIEIGRVRQALARWGDRFLKRIFTGLEIELYGDKPESLAVRFAGKEAAIKALSSSSAIVTWKEVEILSGPDGKPYVRLYGAALENALSCGLSGLEISLSHSREYAIAMVIGTREEG